MKQERFRETQWARENWVINLPFVIVLVAAVSVLVAVFGAPPGERPGPAERWGLALWMLGMVGLYAWFLWVGRLETVVDDLGLRIRWYPLHITWRQIPLESLERVEAVAYRPILEYGGYGIRMGVRRRAYNVVGNKGVRLHYAGDRHTLIGSRKPEELAEAVRALLR